MKLRDLQKKNIGLVLSGGGVKAMAHIGALKALNEYEIYADTVSGVGTGAVIGAFYAKGMSFAQMLDFFKETPLFRYSFFSTNKPGLFDTEKYRYFMSTYVGKDTFEAMERQLFITVTDLQKGIPKTIGSGKLLLPLLASAALPPVFSPVTIDGRLYADGGIMNNFPIEVLSDKLDVIIGSYTSGMKEIGKGKLNDPSRLAKRTKRLMLHANCREKLCAVDILFRPRDLEYIKFSDDLAVEKAYVIGYEHASRYLREYVRA